MLFADVIVPFPLAESYTYSVPEKFAGAISIGHRAIVPFGKRKFYTAIVVALHNNKPKHFEVKEIYALPDAYPIVNENQLKLWRWISFYYITSPGEVYNAALPSGLKPESDSFIELIADDDFDKPLSGVESQVVKTLKERGRSKISELEKQLKTNDLLPHIYELLFKGIVSVDEDVEDRYKVKTERYVSVNDSVINPEAEIGRAKKQLELYNHIVKYLSENNKSELSKPYIQKKFKYSSSVLKGLIDKKLFFEYEKEISRLNFTDKSIREPYPLNIHQKEALQEIKQSFKSKNVCLLHGVTSSGKTEIYIHLIEEQLQKGKQVLYLVPEIALTTQLTARLKAVFGNRLGIYHSKINDSQRTEIWHKMLSDNAYEVIIGVRSSVFLPYNNLGLVIVDEEHESSYKQHDPAPRYHARNVAIVLAQPYDANVLLGSATPSMESFYNAKSGKFGLVTLSKRFEEIELPEIIIENTKELRRKKQMKSLLTPNLIDEIDSAIEKGEQIILFRNRRGFVPLLECKNCGWTPKCKQCDVSLTYHKKRNEFKCHYCGRNYRVTKLCEACNEDSLEQIGMGTEMLEEEVKRLFPDVSVARLDSDATTTKNAYEHVIEQFQSGVTDVLIGTQMLSKGLDFDNVSIVGIVAADGLLSHPDFRSHERGFQLMMQSAGRAGRKHKRGKVIVQAGDPELPVYRFLSNHDYESFFNLQLSERKLFSYPPYTRLISIVMKHRMEQTVEQGAQFFANGLRKTFGAMVLGPTRPVVGYIQRYHIREILIKLDSKLSPSKVREQIRITEQKLNEYRAYRYVQISYDVDKM